MCENKGLNINPNLKTSPLSVYRELRKKRQSFPPDGASTASTALTKTPTVTFQTESCASPITQPSPQPSLTAAQNLSTFSHDPQQQPHTPVKCRLLASLSSDLQANNETTPLKTPVKEGGDGVGSRSPLKTTLTPAKEGGEGSRTPLKTPTKDFLDRLASITEYVRAEVKEVTERPALDLLVDLYSRCIHGGFLTGPGLTLSPP